MTKRLTNLQKYQKEIRRLKKGLSRYREQGYQIETIQFKIPKRVTKKQLEKIQATKPKQLLSKIDFVDYRTGEQTTPTAQQIKENRQIYRTVIKPIMPKTDPQKEEQYQQERKTALGTPYLDNFLDMIQQQPEDLYKITLEIVQNGIKTRGKYEIEAIIRDMDDSLIQSVVSAVSRKDFSSSVQQLEQRLIHSMANLTDDAQALMNQYEEGVSSLYEED